MNKLTRALFSILFVLAIAYQGYAQVPSRVPIRRYPPPPVNRQQPVFRQARPINRSVRVEQVKEGFISSQLRLNPRESRLFWPMYRQYIQEQTAIRILKRQNLANNSISSSEQIRRGFEYDTELINIRKHYNDVFLGILPPAKVSELYKCERAFNDEALKQLSERSVRAGD